MNRIMQHRTNRMFLTAAGKLSPYIWEACRFESLGAAVKRCHYLELRPSDFLFRVLEDDSRSQVILTQAE